MDKIIVVENLVKEYRGRIVLNNINLVVDKHGVYSLLGPNGAGKTTLLNILTGITRPSHGKVEVFGKNPRDPSVKKRIGFSPQDPSLHHRLTGWENIKLYAMIYGLEWGSVVNRVREYVELLGLEKDLDKIVGKYSGGMAKKLSLIISLVHDPDILVFDEPTTGLDPGVRREVWKLIDSFRREGKVVILATHYMEEADKLSDHIWIIDQGRIVAEGDPELLKKKYGPSSVIELVFTEKPSNELINELSRYGNIVLDDVKTRIFLSNPDRNVPEIVNIVYRYGFMLKSLNIVKPSLEDVFLNLTGKRLK